MQVLKVSSDIAKWSVQVRATGNSQIDSFNKHKESMKKTINFLKANGIEDGIKQVYLGPVSIKEYEKASRLMKS